ncbi:MAG TPA: hypothetical protein VK543_12405 [Puia sp.]|nr:hypothetical protein [Puia sp.]
MNQQNIVPRMCMLVGAVLMLAAAYRGLSINNLIIAITTGDISKHLGASVLVDWSLSCILLLLMGIWLFFISADLRKGLRRAWLQGIIIGVSLAVFGGGFWYKYPRSLHLPVFLLLGLMLLIPLIIYSNRFKV